MNGLIQYFIKYPILGNLLSILIAIFGFIGLSNTRSTFFPETETKLVVVQTVYPGASPEEVEEGIVAKIEDNLTGVSGIDRVTSVSSENSGRVTAELKRGYDVDVVLQEIKNAVDQINSFPVGIERPTVFKQEVLNAALNFAISGETDLLTLKGFARKIESDLLAVEGISKVELTGFPEEEIEVSVREEALRRHSLTFEQIAAAIRNANIEVTGGTIKTESEELLIRSKNKDYYARDLAGLVVSTAPDGRKLLLGEVADLRDQWSENPNRTYVNGKPAVAINVSNTNEEQLLFIADEVRKYVDRFNQENSLIKATIIRDGSVVLRQRIDLLTVNGLQGFLLVVLFLAMFLQLRLAFWVALSIPISFLGMFLLAPLIGLSINVISLFGMIIVVGILVDDGIVISENIYQHWERGKAPLRAALDGVVEVLPSVVSAVLTTIVAFSSFLFLEGITGDFFSDLSVVVICTLGMSLAEAAFILPGHIGHSKALHPVDLSQEKPVSGLGRLGLSIRKGLVRFQESLWGVMDWMRGRLYAPVLQFVMKHAFFGLVIPVVLLMLAFAVFGGGLVKFTFFPFVEGDFITATLKMPAGTREEITEQWLSHMEQAVWRVNEQLKAQREDGKDVVQIVTRNIGPSTYQGNLLINLLDGETRNYPSLAISEAIRKEAGSILGAEQVTYGVATPFGKAISVALYGDNLEELKAAVQALQDKMAESKDLRDITDSNQEGLREINVKLKEKALLLGLTPQAVVAQVRQGFFGAEVQRLQRGEDEVRVWVRYDLSDRSSVGKLEDMRIRTAQGQSFPLKEIATFETQRGVVAINRLSGKREIRVEADLASADVSATDQLAAIEFSMLPPILASYPSVSYSFEGQYRENAKFIRSAQKVMPAIAILMLAMILVTFRSIGQTLALLAILPFGLIGVIFGHWFFGRPVSILSVLGVIALVGIMVNDGLVLIATHNGLIQEGKSFREALYEAAVSRFRPIFLTSATTIAGLGPLIFERSFQAQFLIPMAISVAFGLLASTLLVLFTLPVLMLVMNQYKVWAVGLWEGVRPEPAMVEPAYEGRKNYLMLWMSIPLAVLSLVVLLTALMS